MILEHSRLVQQFIRRSGIMRFARVNYEQQQLSAGQNATQKIWQLNERIVHQNSVDKPLQRNDKCGRYQWEWKTFAVLRTDHMEQHGHGSRKKYHRHHEAKDSGGLYGLLVIVLVLNVSNAHQQHKPGHRELLQQCRLVDGKHIVDNGVAQK